MDDPRLARLTGEPEPDKVIAELVAQVAAASLPAGHVPAGPRGQAKPADWMRVIGRPGRY
jgi:hypothetical protein